MNLIRVGPTDPRYPARLHERLGSDAPEELQLLGEPGLLGQPKTALCCSIHCPGVAVNAAYDQAAKWRDAGRCVISGFHSPMEKECLRILLRGPQPLLICPARSLDRMRVPREWGESLHRGRLLVVSAFGAADKRTTAALAARRNELVVALADEVWIAHITPGGATERLVKRLAAWGMPVCLPPNQHLTGWPPGSDGGLNSSNCAPAGRRNEAIESSGQPEVRPARRQPA